MRKILCFLMLLIAFSSCSNIDSKILESILGSEYENSAKVYRYSYDYKAPYTYLFKVSLLESTFNSLKLRKIDNCIEFYPHHKSFISENIENGYFDHKKVPKWFKAYNLQNEIQFNYDIKRKEIPNCQGSNFDSIVKIKYFDSYCYIIIDSSNTIHY